ncbi:MAG TPA: 2-oxo acid dehydrogenase subunit E2, partial [Tepidiformaceae bacterium]|nr:2-oxo acid dehydrogenase subunit E2 [Tepidiformaceae bacterium]
STAAPAATPSTSAAPAPSGGAAEFLGEVMPLTRLRRLIADHMVKSKQTSPHVTTVHEVDMSAVMAAYAAQKDAIAARGGRLTVTAIIVDCVAQALAAHPLVNSSWAEEGVRVHRDIHIGLAGAIPGGLMGPGLKQANTKSLIGPAAESRRSPTRAREARTQYWMPSNTTLNAASKTPRFGYAPIASAK